MDQIVIIGSSGHARVIIDIVEQEGRYGIAGLLDRNRPPGETTAGYPVLGQEQDLPRLIQSHALAGVLIAIGDNFTRSKVAALVAELCPALPFATAIHPRATLAKNVSVGGGTVLMAGAVVNPGCTIGRGCILNTHSSLDHDSVMEDFSSLAPRATTGGKCRLGAHSAVCISATLIHGITVGEHAVVGAGATVLKSIGPFQVAYGTPAKVVRDRKAGDRYL